MQVPTTYVVAREKTSPMFGEAFAKGCRGPLVTDTVLKPGSVAMFGSPVLWPLLEQAQRERRTWFYADHGFQARNRQYRITRDAYQHPIVGGNTDRTRLNRMPLAIQDWRYTGDVILLCPQTAAYHALFGMDVDQWVADVTTELRDWTDRPIIVRTKRDPTPMSEALKTAWAVVCYSSAVAVDALIAGVPSFTLAPWASAAMMGTPDLSRIEDPYYPDHREDFLAVLFNNQWTLEEIARGVAWEQLSRE